MNFELSDEHQATQEMACKFAQKEIVPVVGEDNKSPLCQNSCQLKWGSDDTGKQKLLMQEWITSMQL